MACFAQYWLFSLQFTTMSSEKRDQEAWYAENIQPHESLLRAWLQNRFALGSSVDDIVQEAFLRAIKARERGVLYSPKAFLFKASGNLALDFLKKKANSTATTLAKLEDPNVVESSDSIPEEVSRNQEYQILRLAILSLPERCMTIFIMRNFKGMSPKEIGEVLGISRNTVYNQLTIGLRKCTEFIERFREEGGNGDVL